MNDTQVSGLSNWKLPPTENGKNGGGVDLRLDDEFKENQVETSLGWISRNAQYVLTMAPSLGRSSGMEI